MKKIDLELSVGAFVLVGLACLAFLSIKVARAEIFGGEGYEIYAIFSDTGGLKEGASAVIAGVKVGRVKSIVMDDYKAKITLSFPNDVKIQEDAIASIKTRGLIGEKFLSIAPGASEDMIKPGGRIRETMPPIDIEELVSNYIFGKI
jgi:phospholipid/cholesterol/gamma-HCH transport system substrate-binding protein